MSLARITRKGYARIERLWSRGDKIDLTLAMPVERVEAHPSVRADCGKVALQRGPVVYCLEGIDNGKNLADIRLPRKADFTVKFDRKLGGAAVLVGKALRRQTQGWSEKLYRPRKSPLVPVSIQAVPYCLWNNRGESEMLVWIPEACKRPVNLWITHNFCQG